MQSAFQEKYSYTMVIGRGIGDGASAEGFRQFVSGLVAWNPGEDGGVFPVV